MSLTGPLIGYNGERKPYQFGVSMYCLHILLSISLIFQGCKSAKRSEVNEGQVAPTASEEDVKSLLPITKIYYYDPNAKLKLEDDQAQVLIIAGSVLGAVAAVVGAGAMIVATRGKIKTGSSYKSGSLERPHLVPKTITIKPHNSNHIDLPKPEVTSSFNSSDIIDGLSETPGARSLIVRTADNPVVSPFLQVHRTIPSGDPNTVIDIVGLVNPIPKIQSVGKVLNKGGYGEVVEIKLAGTNDTFVAKRALPADSFTKELDSEKRVKLEKDAKDNLEKELDANSKVLGTDGVGHRGITRFVGTDTINDTKYLIFEKMDGDVSTVIKDGTFKFETKMMDDLLDGLQFLYSKDIKYVDIKPSNMLYTKNANGSFNVKFADIGEGSHTRQYDPLLTDRNTLSKEQQSMNALGLSLLEMRAKQSGYNFRDDPEFFLNGLSKCDTCIGPEVREDVLKEVKNWSEAKKKMDSKDPSVDKTEALNSRSEALKKIDASTDRRHLTYRIMMDQAKKQRPGDAYDQVIENMINVKYKTTKEAMEDLQRLKSGT